ncbi:hypothetical protein [Streptomyces sp. sk2.1]|uniref:hypothetical protein n=1 Tax=Streptomyces sp. sk2.1 TaxID=2478959 RepID=UPI0011E86621|nr:hypothetical protein [Streptomyces sp. sk2.1]TXS63817.1 hypothetical protein EAO76_40480 [Streptomyces sp. sk2.1]
MKYHCDNCDATVTAPTDTDTVRCPGCGEMADKVTAPADAVWADSDPLMQAIAAAVWEQCGTENSIVVDDPRTIAAVAATVARQILGTTDQPCGSRSLPTYAQGVLRCVLATRHAGPCQSATRFPYVSWPNPSYGVWNTETAPAVTEEPGR